MKITVIGYWGAYPEQNGATSSYLLEKDGFKILIDCGSGALSRIPSFVSPTDLDAVILSHYHHDHIADIGPMQYAWLVKNKINGTNNVLPIYGHQGDLEQFNRLTHEATKGVPYDPMQPTHIGPFTFTFIKTKHPVVCYAMKITDGEQTIVYTADSSYLEGFVSFSENADLLITDCSFYDGQDGTGPGHMNSRECGEIAKKANVGEMWLSHLPHFGDVRQLPIEAKNYFSGTIRLAEEGLSWSSNDEER